MNLSDNPLLEAGKREKGTRMAQDDSPNKGAEFPNDQKITFRFFKSQLTFIVKHRARLQKRNPGLSISKSDAVRDLIEIGALAWQVSDDTGAGNPAALLSSIYEDYRKTDK